MPVKLLAFDLDGTVLDHEDRLSSATLRALRAVLARGLVVCTASGRSVRRSQEPFEAYPDLAARLWICAYNGAVVAGPEQGGARALLHEERLPGDLFQGLVDYAARRDLNLVYCRCEGGGRGLVEQYLYVREPDAERAFGGRGFVRDERLLERLQAGQLGPPPKIMLMTGEADREAVIADLKGLFGERVYVAWSLPDRVEVMCRGVDKGTGLEVLAAAAGVSLEETCAIGDANNDLPMLRRAGLGVLMGNARPEVLQAVAGAGLHQAPPLEEEGFARTLETYVLEEKERL